MCRLLQALVECKGKGPGVFGYIAHTEGTSEDKGPRRLTICSESASLIAVLCSAV